MIKLITATERHKGNVGDWLSSHYLFSFADYFDPANAQFGPLKVFNDNIIEKKAGLPDHPHAETEVVTIVLDGVLRHKDNLGNDVEVKAGEVQRLSAGKGVIHSETNGQESPVHFCQLWFLPNKKGIAPSYEHMSLEFLDSSHNLTPLVTGQKVLEDVLYMNSNSTVYYGKLSQGKNCDFKTFKIRKTLIYIIKGILLVNNLEADKNDQVRLEDLDIVSIHGTSDAEFILIDVPALEVNY